MMSRMLIVSPASKQSSHPILISSVTNTSGRTVLGESTGHSRTGGPVERGVQDQTVQQCSQCLGTQLQSNKSYHEE